MGEWVAGEGSGGAMAQKSSAVRRFTPWASVVGLVVLAAVAATASAMTAPAPRVVSASTTTTTVPSSSCPPPSGAPTITLSDILPRPTISVPVGSTVVAVVPGWSWGEATDLNIVDPSVMTESCSFLLSDRGREAVLIAQSTGQSVITATVSPASDLAMPAWEAEVTVTAATPTSSTTSTPTTTTSTTPYSLPPSGALTTSIELPSSTVVAGSTVSGTLVVTNHTDESFNLTQGCKPFWWVGLQSATIPFNPRYPTPCEPAPFYVSPGINRLPFTMTASYLGCSTTSQGSSSTFPACLENGQPPPLPPGPYQAVLVSQTSALSALAVNVQVVAGSG